jgi:DNA-binding response OmpR family regulator
MKKLSPQQKIVFDLLASNAPRVVSRKQILEALNDPDISNNHIHVLIANLRKNKPEATIANKHGQGYLLITE